MNIYGNTDGEFDNTFVCIGESLCREQEHRMRHAKNRFLSSIGTMLLMGLATLVTPASAADLTPTEARAIAKDAYIYGFPIVENYKTMYADAIAKGEKQYKAPFNKLKNEADVFTPTDTHVVTPNADTPYSFLWMDLRSEPPVLGVPEIETNRYYSIQLIDLYTFNFGYIGSRTTGNGAGHYLIAGPNWKGKKPKGVDKVIRCETEFALALYRTQLLGRGDLDAVKNIQSQYTVQTLSKFLGKPAPAAAPEIKFLPPDKKSTKDFEFFAQLNFILQFCPTDKSETKLMASFAKIGIDPGAAFDASKFSPEIQNALKSGLADGQAAIAAVMPKAKSADIFGTRAYLKNDYLKRAVAAKVDLYGNSKEEALYPLYLTDAEGKPLDASKNKYVINLAADKLPPVNAFWSITMYDSKNQRLVSNPIDRYLINSSMLKELKRNADKSLTLFIQHEPPSEGEKANWLPAPNGAFYMVMRLYWPKANAIDGSWTPPLVWPQGTEQQPAVPTPEGVGTAQEVKPSVLAQEPKPEMERPTVWGEPTEVQIEIFIVDVDEVNSADQSFAASVYYEARWNNPLLCHKGPGPMHRGVTEVWNPRLTILGQQNIWRSFPESVEIHPDGEVVYRQRVWGHFSQPLDLREFPKDEQVLNIHIVAAGLMERYIKMVPLIKEGEKTSGIAESFSVPDFEVLSWHAEAKPYCAHKRDSGTAGFQMQLLVARSPTYYVLKVVVPLCLIVMMSWLPRWISADQIGTNVGVSTTSFLTLVAYLFAITVLLPRVSYITRLDRFIFLSTLMVFAGLIHTVVNTAMLSSKKKAMIEQIERLSRVVYPVILVAVLVISFIL